MSNQASNRMRKLLIRDNAGNEMRIETDDASTLAQLEKIYRENTRAGSDDLLFADAGSRRILGNKREKVRELWPGLGDIEIIALPDTVNAYGNTKYTGL